MTPIDPAHPPRSGEGTGPLAPLTTLAQPAHTTGPLPPLPEPGETSFIRSLRLQLTAINEGRTSLRDGLGQIVSGLILELLPDDELLTPEIGPAMLQAVPDVMMQHWLTKVANEAITLEVFLGMLTAEGMAGGMKKTLHALTGFIQQQGEAAEGVSPLTMLNATNQFAEIHDDFKQMIAEFIAGRVGEELKAGLDAHTANQLLTLLRRYKG